MVFGAPTAAAAPQPPGPPPHATPAVRHIYADYLSDGTIDVCAHSLAAVRKTLATIEPEFDLDYPDFRAALVEIIDRRRRNPDTCSHHVTGNTSPSRFERHPSAHDAARALKGTRPLSHVSVTAPAASRFTRT